MKHNWTRQYLINVNIFFEPSSADTQTQNGVAERFGRMMIMKARIMWLFANLSHSMWKEIIETATYFYNQTPKAALEWKSFYKTFHIYVWRKKTVSDFRKSQLHHFRTYNCKCYVLIKFQNNSRKADKFQKLDFCVYIEFLVKYVFTNVYRVWISHKQKIISVQNVIFDEQQIWNGKTIKYIIKNIKQFNETISIIKIPHKNEIENQQFDENDSENIANTLTHNPAILAETDEADAAADEDTGEIANEKNKQAEQDELDWMANQYSSPDSQITETMLVQFIFIAFNAASHSEKMIIETEKMNSMNNVVIKSVILDELKKRQFNRFYDFKSRRVLFKIQKTFIANFKHSLFSESKHYKDLKGHSYEKDFWDSMTQQIKQHKQDFNSWTIIDRRESNEHQMLKCQWIFKYKTNKHGELLKCKTRIVMCDNQQHQSELFTRATILAITVLRILLALIARFNLEILQLDAVNAFVHAFLDEVVFMRMPLGYEEQKKVLWLNKALYDLKRSSLLWQRKFTDVLRRLGFTEIPQEPCIVVRRGIIIFFFVDDCVIIFSENKRNEIMAATNELAKKFIINIIGELKWFLKMHIIRNRLTECLWLFQKTYIKKICKNLMKPPSNYSPATSMNTTELLSAEDDEEISNDSKTLYQRKIGFLLFAAIFTRPDIVFAVSRLFRFNVRFGRKHHAAAERVLQYFYHTRNKCIRYEDNKIIDKEQCLTLFVCASDASFADNTIDRKSS